MTDLIKFDTKEEIPNIIKVIGVGGGGGNAVTHMFTEGIQGVDFILCNTDKQALDKSPVAKKIHLGKRLLGAGNKPDEGHKAAIETTEELREILAQDTKMLFITAGMGGGTGTGAAPVVAEVARELDILTVGIVTLPFSFEGKRRQQQALLGIEELRKHVDALLVISNDKLRQEHGDMKLAQAFKKADDVLKTAAKGIAEIITVPGIINTDFTDVFNTLSNSNVAIMSVGSASGEDRINQSIHEALTSPLVNSDVKGAKRVLLQLYCSSEHPIIMQEFDHIHAFVHAMGDEVEVQWGVSLDENLGEKVRVTLIATGFEVSDIPGLDDAVGKKTVDQAIEKFYGESNAGETIEDTPEEPVAAPTEEPTIQDSDVIINLDEDLLPSTPIADNHPRPVTPEPTREDATWSRSGIAGWMRGRR